MARLVAGGGLHSGRGQAASSWIQQNPPPPTHTPHTPHTQRYHIDIFPPNLTHPTQGLLSTVIVEVKDLLVHASSVGVVYHVFCGRRDRRLAELRVVAVYSVGADDKIRGCEAVSRLLSGGAGDELLASVGIA